MGLNYQKEKWAVGVIKNEENHKIVGDLEDYGINGGTEEMITKLLQSDDPKLDEIFVISTDSDMPLDLDSRKDDKRFLKLNDVMVSRRELMLSMLAGRPYPAYIIDLVRAQNRDTYTTKLREPSEIEADEKRMHIQQNKERANKRDDSSLDVKRNMKFGYTILGSSPEEMFGGLELTPRDLLRAGLDPEAYLEPEVKKEPESRLKKIKDAIDKYIKIE